MRQLSLPLKDSPYTIHIGSSLLADQSLLSTYCNGEKVLIVSNDIVAPLYFEKLALSLASKKIFSIIIKDGEINKSRESYFQIIDYLVEQLPNHR